MIYKWPKFDALMYMVKINCRLNIKQTGSVMKHMSI